MKSGLVMLVMVLLCATNAEALCKGRHKKGGKTKYETASLQEVITTFNTSYDKAVAELSNKIEISEISVNFKVEVAKKGGGSVKVLIFKLGGEIESTKTSSVTFSFNKPEAKKEDSSKSFRTDALAAAIIQSAKDFINLNDLPRGLQRDNFEIELTFGIKKVGSLGVEFEILSAGVGVDGEISKLAEHTLTMKFTMKEVKKPH